MPATAFGARSTWNPILVVEPALDERTQERVARNDAVFRAANEDIRETAVEQEFHGLVPFICECADETCTEIVQLTLPEYEEVRSHPRRFLNVHGHHVHARGTAAIVFERERYIVVEKRGYAGAVAEELDQRE